MPPGEVRVGGFGGVDGLVRYLSERDIDMVVDATHPFARQITANAAAACARAGVPRLLLQRPPWEAAPEDDWIRAADLETAARLLPSHGRVAFLAIGRQELEPFADVDGVRFLIRTVDPPDAPLPVVATVIRGRGPFAVEEETALLLEHHVDVIVTRNSGGSGAEAKLLAARLLRLPVIMVDRPPVPDGPCVRTVDEAIGWVLSA